ncbi:hypothetical protein QM012_008736 [Aureobasidium pullulans]|uniref:Myb-like domain-containing protein n=1 Tax=Aureobasidium pullulans TaxID=5580 RepID=A0ABR0THG8_AURPU
MAFDEYLRARSSSRDDVNIHDTDEYQRGRQRIDLKLKGTFERIFEKYARDFTGVGDEIDMETGEVVVDNGHLTYMQHERDTGKSASSRFVRAFADELEVEDGPEDNDDNEDDGFQQEPEEEEDALHQVLDNDDEDELQHEPRQKDCQDGDDYGREEEDVSDDEDGDYEDAAVEAGDEQSGDESDDLARESDHFALDPRLAQPDARVSPEEQYHSTSVIPSTEISHSLPQISIVDSLNQLVPHQDADGRIDPAAIQQLGQNIANQIAQFLMRATSLNRQPQFPNESQNIWSAPPLPQDVFDPPSFFDRQRSAITPAPHRAPSVWDSPSGGQSLWAPAASRPRKRRRLLKHTETSFDLDPALTDDAAFSDAPSSRNRYSKEEDDLIKRLKEINGLTWQQITARMPGRTTGGLSGRYTRVLKDLPRPVMIKREIIEIMDGEGDELSTPGPSNAADTPGTSPFHTPLLRRAMDKQIARHGDSGEIPITIVDEDDTDSRDSSAPPPDKRKKKRNAKNKDPLRAIVGYRTFDTSTSAGNFGILCTDSPAPYTAEEHNLNYYGPTSGFGVLRMTKPQKEQKRPKKVDSPREAFRNSTTRFNHAAPHLRGQLANTPTSTINLFARAEQYLKSRGLSAASLATSQLRAIPSLPANRNNTTARMSNAGGPVTMMPPPPARPRPESVFQGSSPLPAHPPPPYSAAPPSQVNTPPRVHTPLTRRTEPMVIDTENDGDVSDSSMDTPATAKRYVDAPDSTVATNGPYFLSNMPPPPSPLASAPRAQMRSPSSSPLSSPPLLPSPASSQTSSAESERRSLRSSSHQAAKNPLLPPGPGEVARMKLPAPTSSLRKNTSTASTSLRKSISSTTPKTAATPKTPATRYGTPIRETVGRKEMLKKKAMAEPDDGSEDELA